MTRVIRISRQNLTECPGCRRHVRIEAALWREATCAFCGARIAGSARTDALSLVRERAGGASGRMAAALLGLGLAGAACSEEPSDPLDRPDAAEDAGELDLGLSPADMGFVDARTDSGLVDAGADGGAIPQPMYGLPPPDAGPDDAGIEDGGAPDLGTRDAGRADAGSPGEADVGVPSPLYGVPPPTDGGVTRVDASADGGIVEADASIPQPHYGVVPPLDAGEDDGGR